MTLNKDFVKWWDENEKQLMADACHMSEFHIASVVWEAAVVDLQKQLAAAKEDAEYAWRNVRIFEAARNEEVRKRGVLEAGLKRTLPMLSGAGAGILASEIIDMLSVEGDAK